MACLFTAGGKELSGRIRLQGSKNAVLPIMAASILCGDKCVIRACPDLSDVRCACEILDSIGCETRLENNILTVNSKAASGTVILPGLMCRMRSSVMFAGAMLSKFGRVEISKPGGCEIGARPIDIHTEAFRLLGAEVNEDGEKIIISADRLCGCDITLPFPSVGATENIMLAACLAEGETVIYNSAREPEITDLQEFVNSCGGCISGAGSGIIHIKGAAKLHGTDYRIIPDRIVCATYMFAAAACGGDVTVEDCNASHLDAVCDVLEKMDCGIYKSPGALRVVRDKRLKSPGRVEAGVYPLFPTDAQPLLAACSCVAEGETYLCDSIFPERFGYASELIKMGCDITHEAKGCIRICGKERIFGASLCAKELRGGAALITAALAAEGKSAVDGLCYVDRGYENIEGSFSLLGADISRK